MAGRVYNALGGTDLRPCPTAILPDDICTLADLNAWLEASQRMWNLELSPTWQQYNALSAEKADQSQWNRLGLLVDTFTEQYNTLPDEKWIAMPDDARLMISTITAIMRHGDYAIDELGREITRLGGKPVGTPAPLPPRDVGKPWSFPGLPKVDTTPLVIGGLVVGAGLIAYVVYRTTRDQRRFRQVEEEMRRRRNPGACGCGKKKPCGCHANPGAGPVLFTGLLLASGAVGAWYVSQKMLAEPVGRPTIQLSVDCSTWNIPRTWWSVVAQPKVAGLLATSLEDVTADEATTLLLSGEIGTCVLPPPDAQKTMPGVDNYYAGPQGMIDLYRHVHAVVQEALEGYVAGQPLALEG